MPHSADAPNTPTTAEIVVFLINRAATMQAIPIIRYTIQGRVPQYYSVLMTIGCQMPMARNVHAAMITPVKYIISSLLVFRQRYGEKKDGAILIS